MMCAERLLGELIGLARPTEGNEHLITPSVTAVMVDCLNALGENLTAEKMEALILRIDGEKRRMIPDCYACAAPCGKNNACDMQLLQQEEPRTREAKQQLLTGIRSMAAGEHISETVERFLYKALIVIGMVGFGPEFPEAVVQEMKTLKY